MARNSDEWCNDDAESFTPHGGKSRSSTKLPSDFSKRSVTSEGHGASFQSFLSDMDRENAYRHVSQFPMAARKDALAYWRKNKTFRGSIFETKETYMNSAYGKICPIVSN